MNVDADILEYDVATGRKTGFPRFVARALEVLAEAEVPFGVIGAMALAVRGLPRMTRDLDVVVTIEGAYRALDALKRAGLESGDPRGEINVRVAVSEPESTVIAEAKPADVYGVKVPVASLEHLLLKYLYSNQPKHLGDFARIVTESEVDLLAVESFLADVHPEMLAVFRARVLEARTPPPAPPKPTRKRRR